MKPIANLSTIVNDLTEEFLATIEAFKNALAKMNTKLNLTMHTRGNQPATLTRMEYR